MPMLNPGDRVTVQLDDKTKGSGRVMDTATNCVQVLLDGTRDGVWYEWADVTPATKG
jgi:uncharacterized Zn ribbon protein